jgi:alkylated DNA repair dioxygenase AlkB
VEKVSRGPDLSSKTAWLSPTDAMDDQLGLFVSGPRLPEGFRYQPDLITAAEEQQLLAQIKALPFQAFDFHGYKGKRRVVSFGWKYDFTERRLEAKADIPEFLLPLREKAARFADVAPADLQQALVTEYDVGAPIGWHRDKAVFGDVIGVSLLSAVAFRLRRQVGGKWERVTITAEPRSVYLLRGPSRTEWEHSIPPVPHLRYSVTFRNFAGERDR